MKSGVPLSMLFVLVAVCAAVIGMGSSLSRTSIGLSLGEMLVTAVASMCLFSFLGIIVGMYQFDRRRGIWWGLLVGGVIGLAVVPVIWIPSSASWRLGITSVMGALIVVVIGMCLKLGSG